MHPTAMLSCYCPQRSCSKVIFSEVCVKNSVHRGGGGVCLSACWDTPPPGRHTPWADTPPGQSPPGRHPRPCRWLLQRTVSILLDCILVFKFSRHMCHIELVTWFFTPILDRSGVGWLECQPWQICQNIGCSLAVISIVIGYKIKNETFLCFWVRDVRKSIKHGYLSCTCARVVFWPQHWVI